MIKLDYTLLEELGLGGLPAADKDSLLAGLYERLEINVGTVIAADLSDDQLAEFEKLIDNDDQAAALAWLQSNYPSYKQVVEQELEKLKAEIKRGAPQILEQSD